MTTGQKKDENATYVDPWVNNAEEHGRMGAQLEALSEKWTV